MKSKRTYPIVALNRFIEATRDSGYKNTTSAVAELIDNSLEAGASLINILITEFNAEGKRELKLSVSDNGCGMTPCVLRLALQFGGSTRFNSREGVGRYGMGLPNSSLSQARRVDVYSWTRVGAVWWSHLDVDEIAAGITQDVPEPTRRRLHTVNDVPKSDSGTVVIWSKCDRLTHKKVNTIAAKLHTELGKTFRKQIQLGKSIRINAEPVRPVDPLFLSEGNNLTGATSYGPTMQYDVHIPTGEGKASVSTVSICFSELPIEKWHNLSNEEKRAQGISKNAGVSIIRANREIDYGWFFMGAKRKENYDDWWRCEVQFAPELDELFGVTHTKQGIHPTDEIINILSPDLETVAHELNGRVRRRFIDVRSDDVCSEAQATAGQRDYLLEPPSASTRTLQFLPYGLEPITRSSLPALNNLPGLKYRIEHRGLRDVSFFVPAVSNHELTVLLNQDHPFYDHIYNHVAHTDTPDKEVFRLFIELLILSAARAECSISNSHEKVLAISLRQSWSDILAAFLT